MYFAGEMAHPTAHQVQDRSAGREKIAIKVGNRVYRVVVNMGHQARHFVKYFVRAFVVPLESFGGGRTTEIP